MDLPTQFSSSNKLLHQQLAETPRDEHQLSREETRNLVKSQVLESYQDIQKDANSGDDIEGVEGGGHDEHASSY